MNLGPVVNVNDQLNEALESYTSGQARDIVDACGEESALDAWRQMSDKWCSMRLAHLQTLMKKALFLRTNIPEKELDMAIARWEADIDLYQRATGETYPSSYRRLHLEEMCPTN